MAISSVNFTGTPVKQTTVKKAAIATGAVAAGAATAAYFVGKGKTDATGIKKILPAIVEGFKTIGEKAWGGIKKAGKVVKECASKVWDFIKAIPGKIKGLFSKKAAETVQEAVQ